MSEQKIWELNSQTVCTILGLSFDEKELPDIVKKLKLDPGGNTPYALHSGLVQACSTQNRTSRRLDKLLKERLARYQKTLMHTHGHTPVAEICKEIEEGTGKDMPLSALAWFLVRNRHENSGETEAAVFAAMHMLEHRALRFYDALRRALPDNMPEDVLNELATLSESNERLETKCQRLERKREQLKSDVESIKEDKSRVVVELDEQRGLVRQLTKDFEEISGEDTFDQISDLKQQINMLTDEVKTLTDQLQDRDENETCPVVVDVESKGSLHVPEVSDGGAMLDIDLNGATVTYVGGVESLLPHYRDVVESFGGTFCYHCGRCIQGRKEIEGIVDKTDIVFCPVDINSHNACRYFKKACKMRDKHCYFLRSSGLSMLIKGLENHAGNDAGSTVSTVSAVSQQ